MQLESETPKFGFPPAFLDDRERLLRETPAAIDPYLREGVRWVVLAGEDPHFEQIVQAWERQGRAQLAAAFEGVRILELR